MADFKKGKGRIKQGGTPARGIRTGGDPDSIMTESPSWAFYNCDASGDWSFCGERLGEEFWNTIFPKLQQFEAMSWGDILIKAKKQHHTIEAESLNKLARDRLSELHIEAEGVVSLRLGGTIRLYGFLTGAVYHIIWYDTNHGDNDSCVCRSNLKHT